MDRMRYGFRCAVLGLTVALLAAMPSAAEEEEINNGQDITRPLQRIDLRYQYLDLPPATKDTQHIFTLRYDKPIPLDAHWQLAFRFDVPLIYTNALSNDNPGGACRFGVSDFLAQGFLIYVIDNRWAVAGGTQLILPTGSLSSTTFGAYRLVPTAAVRAGLPEISPGSFFAGVVRYDFDFAGRSERAHKSELQLSPLLNVNLPDRWFVTLFPSTDIKINLTGKRPGDSGRLFLPFNAMAGKMITKSIVGSLEIGVPIVNDYKQYDFKMEFRVGFFF